MTGSQAELSTDDGKGGLAGLFGLAGRLAWPGTMSMRAPLSLAILSISFQEVPLLWPASWSASEAAFALGVGALITLSAILVLSERFQRAGLWLLVAVSVAVLIPDWVRLANHTYLALWAVPVALLFKRWWDDDLYALYLRLTLSLVMFAALAQKFLAGTYVDGSFLEWMNTQSDLYTRQMFSLFCPSTEPGSCGVYAFASWFILAWQAVVAVLLLIGVTAPAFLVIEVGFLLGAGVFADEMNFQVLNIALLFLIFRTGLPAWLYALCIPVLFLDIAGINGALKWLLG
jgi:hypothetical protein